MEGLDETLWNSRTRNDGQIGQDSNEKTKSAAYVIQLLGLLT